ncbi:unnamed protein product [Caretta caretta]
MAWRMDTPATGDLVSRRPSLGVTAGSGQWEDNGLWRENPGYLNSRFQPEGKQRTDERRSSEKRRPRQPVYLGQKTKDRGGTWGI